MTIEEMEAKVENYKDVPVTFVGTDPQPIMMAPGELDGIMAGVAAAASVVPQKDDVPLTYDPGPPARLGTDEEDALAEAAWQAVRDQ